MATHRKNYALSRLLLCSALVATLLAPPLAAHNKKKPSKDKTTLQAYLKELPAPQPTAATISSGSLYTPNGLLAEPFADLRAHQVGDTISIQITESTTIAQSGSVATDREFSHSSAVTGVGGITPSFLNPLLAANASTKLTGTGATASKSTMNTTLTAEVVAVLPNGSLVLEAHRHLLANHEHENLTLRGVVRPLDINAGNFVYSYQLFNLQLEVEGKGIISDAVRQPNIVIRTLMKWLGM
jgi:flagellar L-ring protein precursor FlgH